MSKNDVYNPNKYFHYKSALDKISKGKLVSPVNLQVDLTNKCNNNCIWCYHHIFMYDDFNHKDTIPENVMKNSLASFKKIGGKSVEWTGGGEPTIVPYFSNLIEKAQELKLGQALVTNGKKLNNDLRIKVKNFDWVRVSLDCSTSDTYLKQHGAGGFEGVLDNLEKFSNERANDCVLGISMIANENNYKEMASMTRLAKDIGANNVRISLAYTPHGEKIFDGIWEKVVAQMEESCNYQDENFRVFTFSERIHALAKKTGGGRCYYNHLTTALGANGALYPCCYFKYLPEYNLGNINQMSFEDVWYGERRRKFIGTVGKNCESSCWMAEKNKLAEYITRKPNEVPHLAYP